MKFIIFGNKGQLGKEFCKVFNDNKEEFIGYDLPEVDIFDYEKISNLIKNYKPDIIINCASFNDVELAELNYNIAYRTNVEGVNNLVQLSKLYNIKFVHFSTDYIFDGVKKDLYTEVDLPNPLNKYGKSKLEGEKIISNNLSNFLIFRLSWLYGNGTQNFIYKILKISEKKDAIYVADDEVSIPTSTRLVVEVTNLALQNNLSGLFHITNVGATSRLNWVKEIYKIKNIEKKVLVAKMKDFNLKAVRPHFSAMDNKKIAEMLSIKIPSWEEELYNFLIKNK